MVDGYGFFEECGVFFVEYVGDGDFDVGIDGVVNLFYGGFG